MSEDTYDLLARIVAEAECFPNWDLDLVDEDGAKRLVITIMTVSNYDHNRPSAVRHFHPCPIATYNEKSWRRWVFDQCVRTMNHEIGEALRCGAYRPRPSRSTARPCCFATTAATTFSGSAAG